MERTKRYIPLFGPLLGRLLIGAPFMLSGIVKLGAHETTVEYLSSMGLPFAQLAWRLAIAVQLGGGMLLLIGYRARRVAAILAGFALATAVFLHRNLADPNQLIHFLANLMLAGGLLQIVYFGAGPLSLDASRGRLWPKWTGGVTGDRVDFTTL